MTLWNKIISEKELISVKKIRSLTYIVERHRTSSVKDLEEEGWEVYRIYKDPKFVGMKKHKQFDEVFEDKVWTLFANMGFSSMNKDRQFKMLYNFQNKALTKQIDVFAVDEETIVFIECKAAQSIRDGNFKTEIESYAGIMNGLRSEALKQFPSRKVKFIWATSNYIPESACQINTF